MPAKKKAIDRSASELNGRGVSNEANGMNRLNEMQIYFDNFDKYSNELNTSMYKIFKACKAKIEEVLDLKAAEFELNQERKAD
jgi:hypothetical protein